MEPNKDQFDIIDYEDEQYESGTGTPQDTVPNEDEHAARMTIMATSTIDPKRPRTVRAGYEYHTQTLTVVFRDDGKGSMWWNYYNVPYSMWEAFRDAPSKGRYLANSGLDKWPDMGPANMGAMSPAMIRGLNKSRTLQKARYGKQSRRLTGPRAEAALNRYMRGIGQQ